MKQTRAPIVTVLGHVDHGKTTLLDTIRKTQVAAREAGGITQKIGASTVNTSQGKITFIDTPGHAAFREMRSRGARVADIAILVVAADDGAKPQTKEALTFIQEAAIPFIVAFTKTDLPSANIEKARSGLEELGVYFEGRGGDTPSVPVSAKKGEGIDDILEMIILMSQVNEIVADSDAPLNAMVIETNKDKRGLTVSAVVRDGKLKVGEEIIADGMEAKIRGLFNEEGKPVKELLPGDPALILGFTELPGAGSTILPKGTSGEIKKKADKIVPEIQEGQVPVVVKALSSGSLEALLASLPKEVAVIAAGIGDVTETDVFLAKSSGARIVTFEAKIPTGVAKLADTEGVAVNEYKIIYELIQKLEELIIKSGDEVIGKAIILAIFPYEKKKVAGSKVMEGRIKKGDAIIIKRDDKEVGQARITSIRREKQIIDEAKSGEECGILFEPQLDFAEGDVILSVKK